MTDPTTLSATDLWGEIADRKISPVEVASAFLDRIEAENDINAIVSLRPRDEILKDARRLQDRGPGGALYGLPIAIKDLADTAGLTTTYGSPIFATHVPDADCNMVTAIKAAGALVIGKTNTPQWGLGSHTTNPVFGPTLNPYNKALSAGGSSGGAAAALAARLLPIADGSDMMGSLRNPAGWNNVYGFRPTYGVVPGEPVGDSFLHQLATSGPMAREPKDLWRLLQVQAAAPRGPHHERLGEPDFDARMTPTIGWYGDMGGALPMEDGVLSVCEGALHVLEDLGCRIVNLPPPPGFERLWQAWVTLRAWTISNALGEFLDAHPGKMNAQTEWEIETGRALTAEDVHRASLVRSDWNRAFHGQTDVDVCALPSAQMFPFDVTLDWPKSIAGTQMDTYHRWMEVVIPVSLIGIPAVSLPAGFSSSGLPMGLQVFGHRGADAELINLAHGYHRATDWPNRKPPPRAKVA